MNAILNADAGLSNRLRGVRPTAVLVVAAVMSAWYGVEMLIDAAAPRVVDTDPVIGLFGKLSPVVLRVEFWCFLAAWVMAAVVWMLYPRLLRQPRGPLVILTTAGLLVAPYLVLSLHFLFGDLGILLTCLLSTGAGLWATHRMQRFRRMPLWLLLGGFGWGALVASGFGGSTNLWYLDYAPRYAKGAIESGVAAGDLTTSLRVNHDINVGLAFNAGLFEELAKGAGVVLVFLVLRRHFDGVVSGLALGAAIGLGFNLTESVEFTAAAHGDVAYFQYFMRQSVGLMASHAAFTAIIGAGLGVARQLADRRLRTVAVAGGLLAGVGSHFACDVIFPWFGRAESRWFHVTPVLDTVVLPVLILVVVQGPVIVMYSLLLRAGGRSLAAGLDTALHAEVQRGSRTVTDLEIPVLLNPARRFWLRVMLLRRYGWAAYRAMDRLQQAQLTLATQLWHRARGETAPDAPDDNELRIRVLRQRRDPGLRRLAVRAPEVAA